MTDNKVANVRITIPPNSQIFKIFVMERIKRALPNNVLKFSNPINVQLLISSVINSTWNRLISIVRAVG